jgi:Zn ribbon nucleic-acid-binding protein
MLTCVTCGSLEPTALAELRRKRRNAKTYRYQKRKRRSNKLRLIDLFGGACVNCGYRTTPAALEFHHRDATTKEFGVGNQRRVGSLARRGAEV